MNTALTQSFPSTIQAFGSNTRKELFRHKFQRSLRACLRRGFSLEESFGMIWVETWEEISLSESEQGELYEELIKWAKNWPKS